MGRLGTEHPNTVKALVSPTIRDLEWAAGFLEGEGCFRHNGGSQTVTAPQKDIETLVRLQSLFGGKLGLVRTRGFLSHTWTVSGSRARGVMMTLYGLLSNRRKAQIRRALA